MERFQPRPTSERDQHDPKVEAALKLLDAGIERIHDSDEFKRYLEFSAKFHRYSANNQLLIWMQKPEATRVMGYGAKDGSTGWKSVGRQVRSGEREIKIFAPLIKKDVDPATGEIIERLRGYRMVNVFDVSQTDGEPLPEAPRPREIESQTEVGRRLFTANWDWLATRGVPVFRADVPGHPEAKGSYLPGAEGQSPKIHVRSDMAIDMQAKTLAHESAHYVADHRWHTPREEAELVAESAAFVVANRFGLDTQEYSAVYVTHWSHDRELFKQKLSEISTVAKTIINGVEPFYQVIEPQRETSVDTMLTGGLPQRLPSFDELR